MEPSVKVKKGVGVGVGRRPPDEARKNPGTGKRPIPARKKLAAKPAYVFSPISLPYPHPLDPRDRRLVARKLDFDETKPLHAKPQMCQMSLNQQVTNQKNPTNIYTKEK
uniref:Uncharacterized protein n=1 Tax=Timema poppense TaxID=170557 RepID=A0A7R9DHR8_TIMPO|nr:unnamed protein product [Timema poppensis]